MFKTQFYHHTLHTLLTISPVPPTNILIFIMWETGWRWRTQAPQHHNTLIYCYLAKTSRNWLSTLQAISHNLVGKWKILILNIRKKFSQKLSLPTPRNTLNKLCKFLLFVKLVETLLIKFPVWNLIEQLWNDADINFFSGSRVFEEISLSQHKSYRARCTILHNWVDVLNFHSSDVGGTSQIYIHFNSHYQQITL